MKFALLASTALAITACSSGSTSPDGACHPTDPTCNPPASTDASAPHDASASRDASSTPEASLPRADASAPDSAAPCTLWVDDAGVTQGCGGGGMGPGDRDDGGGGPPPPPPDAALDASDLPFGASCWDNAECASDLCFDYKVRGTFCTRICTTNADCPPPSPGCNGMGVCRMPDTP